MTPEIETANARYSLGDFLAVLRRRKWVVIEATVLVTAVAMALSMQQSKVYRASAEVLLSRQDLGAALTGTPVDQALSGDPTRFGDTQAALARVPEVAARAVAAAKVPNRTAAGLLAESTVSPKNNADLLSFTVDDPDPAGAARLANAYASAFTAYRLALDTSTLHRARLELDARIANLRGAGDTTSVLYRSLVDKDQQLRTMELLQTRNSVVKQATIGHKILPTPLRDGMLGAAFGLILGIALALVWDALDKRIRDESEIEQRLGLPLLARLPEPPRRLSSDGKLAMLVEPSGIDAEAIRRLSTNMEFANLDRHAHVVMISSSLPREGKSTTVANLALAFARAGRNVVLVDLDLRQPSISSFFRVPQPTGITDVALRRASLEEAIVQVPLAPVNTKPTGLQKPWRSQPGRNGVPASGPSLSVLPAGPLPPSPGEFLGTDALGQVLKSLRGHFDLVLIDSPPIGVVGDAITLSSSVDAMIVVARLGAVDRSSLDDLARELTAARTPVLGYVLTGADTKGHHDYGGYLRRKPDEQPLPSIAPKRAASPLR